MASPVLYGPAFSTYVRSARLALEEKGVGYRLEEIDVFAGAHGTPEYLARHPFAKVPAFEHDGFALYETCAITRYVDEGFNGPSLQPGDPQSRARMTQAISTVDAYVYPSILRAIVIQRLVRPLMGETPDEAVIEAALDQAKTCVAVFDRLLDGSAFLAGKTLSLADLHLAPIVYYFAETPEGERLLGEAPNLTRWWAEVRRRPSVEKTTPSLG